MKRRRRSCCSGTAPGLIASAWRISGFVGYQNSGVEMRGNSAVDIALSGISANQPASRLPNCWVDAP